MFWTLGLSSWFVGYAISGGLQNFQFALIVAVTLMALGAVLIYAHNAQQREVLEKNNAVLRGESRSCRKPSKVLRSQARSSPRASSKDQWLTARS